MRIGVVELLVAALLSALLVGILLVPLIAPQALPNKGCPVDDYSAGGANRKNCR
jgi:hypothetical protein